MLKQILTGLGKMVNKDDDTSIANVNFSEMKVKIASDSSESSPSEHQEKNINKKTEWSAISQKYIFIKILRKGSSSTVIKAQCKNTGKIFAIKVIKEISSSNENIYELVKISRELHIMKELTRLQKA